MERKMIPWGKILSYEKSEESIIINGEYENLKIEFITDKIVRLHFSKDKNWNHNYSFAIEKKLPKSNFEILEKEKDLILKSKELFLLIDKNSGNIKIFNNGGDLLSSDYENLGYVRFKNKVYSFKKMDKEEAFLGLGEKLGGLNKKGKKFVNWNTDDPHHYPNTDPLYQTHPFFLAWNMNFSYGIFFDNTFRTFFNLGEENNKYFYFYADNGEMDYYFIYGPSPKEVIEGYTFLIGRYYMPPIWSLGYQQSKWGYGSLEKVKEIAENFRNKNIPCDVIYLDIDHLEDFKVFTVDKEKFPNMKELIEELDKKGFKLIPIVDPGVKKDVNFEIFKDGIEKDCFCKKSTGEIYIGYVWPGECAFPDFVKERVREWWGEKQRKIIDLGFSGVWNDMNEPSSFSHPINSIYKTLEKNNTFWGIFSDHKDEVYYEKTFPKDVVHGEKGEYSHDEIHNVYGLLMVKASFEGWKKEKPNLRPLILTRAGYSGIQKYSAVWTGDNKSWWEHLYISIPMLQNLSISGVPFVGADVGGFGLDSSPELFARWIELGIFYPFLRNHSELNTKPQEPWSFGEEIENIARKYIKLRYRLIPYLYSLFWEAKEKGIPPLRALILEFPHDPETLYNDDEFMLGPNLLIAPIYREGARARVIYLPKGKWYDFWTRKIYEGNNYFSYYAPLDIIPVFIKEGSIIPLWEPQNYVGEKKQEVLEVLVFPSIGNFIYYEDDGISWNYQKKEYNLIKFSIKDNIFEIEYLHKNLPSERKIFRVNFLGRIIEIEDKGENIKIKL
ncbi:MAG: glycoside hydrolase family 31 protein [Dictyoglomaceae bacterium]|nr:glycoside hydrolase family 31 protein [Dictyoglomaceae bacterium]